MSQDPQENPNPNSASNASSSSLSHGAVLESSAPIASVGFEFRGDTMEYFRIWIVNLMLSVVTLGIYVPWAQVRSRRYLYANTYLDGHSFDYLAKPVNLLIGYLVVVAFFGLYLLAGVFNPLFVAPVVLVYLLAFPWLAYKALRFRTRNTAYRNVRFGFDGTLGNAYAAFMGWALLVPFTFGLITPYWVMKQKEYALDNMKFGEKDFSFKPMAGTYYAYYIIFGLIVMGLYVVGGALFVGALAATGMFEGLEAEAGTAGPPEIVAVILMVVLYPLLIVVGVVLQKGLWAKFFVYNLSVLKFGEVSFESDLRLGRFLWISVTNALASIATLGLLLPWATIRARRYLLETTNVFAPGGDLGTHVDAGVGEEGAVGESAAEFMDFEIGL